MPPNDCPCDPRPLGWQDLYVTLHFLLVLVPSFSCLLSLYPQMPFLGLCGTAVGIFVSLTAFGLLFDGSISALVIEAARLLIVLMATWALCPGEGYRALPLLPGLTWRVAWRGARRAILAIHVLSLLTVLSAYSAAAALRAGQSHSAAKAEGTPAGHAAPGGIPHNLPRPGPRVSMGGAKGGKAH